MPETQEQLMKRLGMQYAEEAPPDPGGSLRDVPVDLGLGFGKGALSTGAHILDVTQRMSGTPRTLEDPQVQSMITPTTPAQHVGFGAEKVGEFMLPGGMVNRGAQAVAGATAGMRGANLMNLAARSGLEGASGAGVAGLQTGFDPEAMKEAGYMGAGASALTGAAGEALPWVAGKLKESAVTQYGRAVSPSKEKAKLIAEGVIPQMIERRIWGSLPNILQKSEDRIKYFGSQIDDVWDQLAQMNGRADITPLLKRLEDVAKEHFLVKTPSGQLSPLRGPAEKGLNELGGIAQTLKEAAEYDPQLGQHVITTDTLRSLRQYWDEIADKGGAFTKRPADLQSWLTAMTHRYAGDAIRAELGQALPDLAKINKEYAFWRNVQEITDRTLTRRVGQQLPLYRRLAEVQGAIAGGSGLTSILGGMAMKRLDAVMSGPLWQTLSAVYKDKLANALITGNKGAVEFYLKQALKGGAQATITIPESQNLPVPRQPQP
jgi:hypothetical protein